MSDVYVRHGYAWAPGSRVKVDADTTGRALERIEQGGEGLPLYEVVHQAKDPRSPLHVHFEWNDRDAGDQWRLEQAAHLVRSLRYRLVNPRTEDETIGGRVYQPVSTVTDDTSRPGVYLRVTTKPAAGPAPRAHAPSRFTVRTTPAPAPLPTPVAHTPAAHVPAASVARPAFAPPPAPIVMKPSREGLRAALLRLVDGVDDPYFADVIAAIHALP